MTLLTPREYLDAPTEETDHATYERMIARRTPERQAMEAEINRTCHAGAPHAAAAYQSAKAGIPAHSVEVRA